jgi:hypothetical protein
MTKQEKIKRLDELKRQANDLKKDVDYYMTLPQNDIFWPGPDYEWLRKHLAPGMFQ